MSGSATARYGLTVVATAVAYWLAFQFNEHVLFFTRFEDGVNWVYLPSGLRLTLVLVFGWPAAFGIACASVFLAAAPHPWSALPHALVTGLISGFAPLLALLLSRRWLLLREDLNGLDGRSLLLLAAVFAVTSAALHQLWYAWPHPSPDPFYSFAVMSLGDLAGSLIVLYLCRWSLLLWSPRA